MNNAFGLSNEKIKRSIVSKSDLQTVIFYDKSEIRKIELGSNLVFLSYKPS